MDVTNEVLPGSRCNIKDGPFAWVSSGIGIQGYLFCCECMPVWLYFQKHLFFACVNNLVFLAFQYINDLEKDRQYWGWPKDLQEVCGVLFNTVLLQIVQNCLFIFSYLAFFGTLARRMHLGFCVKLSEDNGTGVDRDVRFKAKSL